MKDYYEQAKALREQVAELDELIHHPRNLSDEPEKYEHWSDQLWNKHVELLKKVYPSPNPQDKIQVKLGDYYRDALVLITSFTDLTKYKEAYDQLGWNYDLISEQVSVCECCDEFYLVKDGCSDKDGRGFCKQSCLSEDQFERELCADKQEYDLFVDYYFPDGNPYERDVPQF